MRPSRSHESLSSPISTAIASRAAVANMTTTFFDPSSPSPSLSTPTSANSHNNNNNNTPQFSSRIIHAYQQQPLQQPNYYTLIDQIVKIDVSGGVVDPPALPVIPNHHKSTHSLANGTASTAAPSATTADSPLYSPRLNSSLPVSSASFGGLVHSLHNSLLNEENCFEMRCPSSVNFS